MKFIFKPTFMAVSIAIGCVSSLSANAQTFYVAEPVPIPAGINQGSVTVLGFNDAKEVVGSYYESNYPVAFYLSEDGVFKNFHTECGSALQSNAFDINNNGVVIGQVTASSSANGSGFEWSPRATSSNCTFYTIGSGSENFALPLSINDSGKSVGSYGGSSSTKRAPYLRLSDGTVPWAWGSGVYAFMRINNQDTYLTAALQVGGIYQTYSVNTQNNTLSPLVSGAPIKLSNSNLALISTSQFSNTTCSVYDIDQATETPIPNGFCPSEGSDINSQGIVVFGDHSSQVPAYVYDHSIGQSTDLNTLILNGSVSRVYAINDNGTIVAKNSSGEYVYLNPVASSIEFDNTDDNVSFSSRWLVLHGDTKVIVPLSAHEWQTEDTKIGFKGVNYHTIEVGQGNHRFTWPIEVDADGDYEIFAWWPQDSGNNAHALYSIAHSGGVSSLERDQSINGGSWVSLGTFSLTADGNHSVSLSDAGDAGTDVIADAIKVELR